jgi:hypothetical protein
MRLGAGAEPDHCADFHEYPLSTDKTVARECSMGRQAPTRTSVNPDTFRDL